MKHTSMRGLEADTELDSQEAARRSNRSRATIAGQSLIKGRGVMAGLIRSHDWTQTVLGSIRTWPSTLITQVNLLLASTYPATLEWGEEMIFFYNDAAIPTLGPERREALGKPARQLFSEAWDVIGPDLEACLRNGDTVVRENFSIPLVRNKNLEQQYYAYFVTPIFDGRRIVGIRGVHQNTTRATNATRERDALAEQLSQLLDATSDGVISVRRDWRFSYLNRRAMEILQSASLLNADMWESFSHQVYPGSPYVAAYHKAMDEGVDGSFEAFYPEPLQLWLQVQVRPTTDGIVVFIRDTTEQRRTDELLRKAAAREQTNLTELFEQTPAFICVLDGPDHVFEMANQRYRELLGNRDLIGHRVVDCVPEVKDTGWIDLLDAVYNTGIPHAAQGARLQLAPTPGAAIEDRFVDYVYQPRKGPDGAVTGIIALGVDVSMVAELMESTSDGVLMLDHQWRFRYINSQARRLLQCEQMFCGKNIWETFPEAKSREVWGELWRPMLERTGVEFVSFYPAPLELWFEVHAYPTHQGISIFLRDITARRKEEERLRLLEQTVAAAPLAICLSKVIAPGDCPLIYVNPAFEQLTGYRSEEVVGSDCRFLQGSDLSQQGRTELRNAVDTASPAKVLMRNYKKNGQQFSNEVHLSPVFDEHNKVSHIVGIQNDVTDNLKIRHQLAQQARYDALTGLANRYLLLDGLKGALDRAQQNGSQVAVVILDLDNFKHMNDRFGHMEADRLLVQISRRLNSLGDSTDTVARLGGDEFALVLSDWGDPARLEKQLERLLLEIKKPLTVADQEVMVTASAGVSIYPQDSSEPEDLMQMADLSMYWIKRCGKNSFRFYSTDLRFNQNQPLDVAVGFRRALMNREFQLLYQPRVQTESKRVTGFEALIRWNHPERGTLVPSHFVRIAEDTGLINEIGQWVLEEALLQNTMWRKAGLHAGLMSVNVSAAQIINPAFPSLVAQLLAGAGLPPDSLELELTESLLIDNAALAEASLRALKQLGVRIAIDDFGSGYSGLHYLSRFPVDTIKIDYFFTRDIATSKTAATICQSVLKLGRDLGLTTVAEGVESSEQVSQLKSWRCSELQGYLFGRPLPAQAAEQVLERSR